MGVTIGIFAIIMVFSLVDSMERNIRDMISGLGDDLVFIEKWPITIEEGETEYPWWKYWQRPEPSESDMEDFLERSRLAQAAAFKTETQAELSFGNNKMPNTITIITSHTFGQVYPLTIAEGRFFNGTEGKSGRPVAVIGDDVSQSLFGRGSPIGRTIKVDGRKCEVIGLMEREGESILGDNLDDVIIIPTGFGRQVADLTRTGNTIMVKAKEGISVEQLKDEVIGIMRSVHRLRPGEEKDFSLNQVSMITNMLDGIFGFFTTVALVIGMFSILVGGFGIANIMFVSVKERTNLIGIQKALGAKQAFILLQFLVESMLLSLIGGLLALLIIYILTFIATSALGFDVFLSMKNVGLGLGITLVIGLIAGIVPAWQAARMDPVEAIRAKG